MICHLKVIVHSYQHKKKKADKKLLTLSLLNTDEEFIFNIAQPWPTLSSETLGMV